MQACPGAPQVSGWGHILAQLLPLWTLIPSPSINSIHKNPRLRLCFQEPHLSLSPSGQWVSPLRGLHPISIKSCSLLSRLYVKSSLSSKSPKNCCPNFLPCTANFYRELSILTVTRTSPPTGNSFGVYPPYYVYHLIIFIILTTIFISRKKRGKFH